MQVPTWVRDAKAGDFVVAIMPVITGNKGNEPIKKGQVYEISEVLIVPEGYTDSGDTAFRLKDFYHGFCSTGFEATVPWEVFKPVKPLPKEITTDFIIKNYNKDNVNV